MAVCQYHPGRTGIGICMRCRVVICGECCTRVDGVNHCHNCLKVLAQRQRGREAMPQREVAETIAAALILAAAGLILFGMSWMMQGRLAP